MLNVTQETLKALTSPVRYITQKVFIYFEGELKSPVEVTQDVISIDVLEELTSSTQLPFGEVSYNEATIELDNMTGKYSITNDLSPYAGKLVANILVRIDYQVEISTGQMITISGGYYYTDTWPMNVSGGTVQLICYDKLSTIGYKPVKRFQAKRNISFRDAFILLMESVGISSSEYILDEDIEGTLGYFWCTDDTLSGCLNSLAMTTGCNVYVDKNNKIRIDSIKYGKVAPVVLSDDNLIISTKISPAYSNICSGVRIQYPTISGTEQVELYKNEELEIPPGISTHSIIFGNSPVIAVSGMVLSAKSGCKIKDYVYDDKYATIQIENTKEETVTGTLMLVGKILKTVDTTYFTERISGVNNILEVTIPLICSESYVNSLAEYLLDNFSSMIGTIEVDMRGFPPIELGDILTLNSPSTSIAGKFQVLSCKTQMSNGLYNVMQLRPYTQEVVQCI